VSPWWWGNTYPYYYPYSYGYPAYSYPYPSYAYPPAYDDRAAYPDEDQVYVQQPSQSEGRSDGYWYYCESKRGYYPRVAECPEDWIKVPPRAE